MDKDDKIEITIIEYEADDATDEIEHEAKTSPVELLLVATFVVIVLLKVSADFAVRMHSIGW